MIPKKLLLVDGNAILHRAFHALPLLTNKEGIPTNAVYGFFAMFLKLLHDLRPTHVIVCFDRPKPTFRQELFAGYQQNRPSMSDMLVPQILVVHTLLEEMQVTIFELDGFEADDLIGTLAKQAVETHHVEEVLIVSGDRDLLQLVNEHVTMIAPVTGISNMIIYNTAKVEEKFGITPSQIIDYKALIGDASDGYPGVTGIGPKTASTLLQKYETFENLYVHIAELSEGLQTKLATDAEQAALAKKLATIITDAPITLHIEDCCTDEFNIVAVQAGLEKLGIKSLGGRLPKPVVKKKVTVSKDQLGLLE